MAKRALLALLIGILASSSAWAVPTAEQKAEIEAVAEAMGRAATLFKEKKYQECGEAIREAQEKMEALGATGDRTILRQLELHHKRLTTAHALLELEGIELPAVKPLGEPKPASTRPMPRPKTEPKPEPMPAADGPSFVSHIAPLLITRCGNCHVNQEKGDFSAATYASLMKGAGMAGKVIFPGDASGSRVIEVIETGDMPRGGQKLTAAEFEILKKWINDGAKFDGDDENGSIKSLSSAPPSSTPEEPMIVQATGKETVSFAREIAPVLAQNCNGCHGTNRPRENFSLANFSSLMKGGDGGAPIVPGNPAASVIIGKLKGTAGGQRMPAGGLPPLADAVIAKIETWIEEGAKFDGPDAGAPLSQVASLAKAAGASHEELKADRMQGARATWNMAMPEVKFDAVETDNFYAMGTVGENTLRDIIDRAERLMPKVAEAVGAPSDQPLVKGRFTIFVVNVRYDFSEIGKVLTGMPSVPSKTYGLWKYDGVDAAGVVLAPKNDSDYAVDALIAQQIAAAYMASTGKNVPKWFAEGTSRVVASRLAARDPRVQQWDSEVPRVFASLSAPDAFLSAKFEPEDASIASYSYARFLMNDARRFNQLMEGLRGGGKFDELFKAAYGDTPNAYTQKWWQKGPPRPTRPARAAPKTAANRD
jgi:mono/diheme cytochrome c family protein